MKKQKIVKKNPYHHLLRPFSMETKKDYILRFNLDKEMVSIFPDIGQRVSMAEEIFKKKLENATVTVKRLNGDIFFID